MKNFNKDRRFGGQRFGDRDQRRTMYPAVCADCGNECEVPFKPMHGKAVYCNNCFKRDGDFASDRPKERDSGRFERRDSGRPSFRDKEMHAAICAECGNECQVPFRPTGERPVYCSNCFGGKGPGPSAGAKKPDQFKETLNQLNTKLDQVIKMLEIMHPKKTFIIDKPESILPKPELKESLKETSSKKKVEKKAPKTAKSKKKAK